MKLGKKKPLLETFCHLLLLFLKFIKLRLFFIFFFEIIEAFVVKGSTLLNIEVNLNLDKTVMVMKIGIQLLYLIGI